MGVPSLFRSIVKKYPNCFYAQNQDTVEHLYLDFNCLIHHCAHTLSFNNDQTQRDIEEQLIISVISYTSHIICEVVKPTKLVYIAIDGPVPMGKIVQQRKRRYKKIQDDNFIKKLKDKYNCSDTNSFNSNKITPGTVFMSKLCNRIKNLIALGVFSSHIIHTNKKYHVFFSDANTPGEGEHKIINFINNSKNTPNSIIYGLDADLIILSMGCKNPNIKLLREPQNTSTEISDFTSNHEFVYIDILIYTTSFISEYNLKSYDKSKILNDIVFLSFIGGNDFVEPFINTKIREKNNFTKLINIYTSILFKKQDHLIIDEQVNNIFFTQIIYEICLTEDNFVKRKNTYYNQSKDIEETNYENELQNYYHSVYISDKNPFFEFYKGQLNSINYKLPHKSWKQQYYNTFSQNSDINNLCQEYLKSLLWTYNYYTKSGIPSWNFYYKYRIAPLSSDLYNFLKTTSNNFKDIKFIENNEITPLQQLLIVTPIQHSSILPWSFQQVYKEDIWEPIKFKLDILKGGKNIYSDPILPDINLKQIDKFISNIPVTEIEKTRNIIRNNVFCMKF